MSKRANRPPVGVWLLVVALVVSGAGFLSVADPASSASPGLTITNVTVSPEQPTPGQLTKITTTIRNPANGSGTIEVTDIYVRRQGSAHDLTRVEDLGSVVAGESRGIPLTLSFEESGVEKLLISVVGRNAAGDSVRVQYPVTVVISEGGPQLNIDVPEPTVLGETTMAVNVTNGELSDFRNLNLTVSGSNVRVRNPRRIAAKLESGRERRFTYTATFAEKVPSPVTVRLQYKTAEGQIRTVSRTTTVRFADSGPPGAHPQIELSVDEAFPGTTRPVNVTVANGLDHDIRQVRIRAASPEVNFTVTERVRARLAAGTSATLRYPASVSSAGKYPVNVTLEYTYNGVRHRTSQTIRTDFTAPSNPGEITLTGTEAVQRGGNVEISATAGNLGSTAVEGVVVSVGYSERVGSTTYFVGDVDASDFSSFTLRTSVDGNVSSVPLEVRYSVDGIERTFTTDVPVDRAAVQPVNRNSGGPPLVPVIGVIALLTVAAGVVLYRRRG